MALRLAHQPRLLLAAGGGCAVGQTASSRHCGMRASTHRLVRPDRVVEHTSAGRAHRPPATAARWRCFASAASEGPLENGSGSLLQALGELSRLASSPMPPADMAAVLAVLSRRERAEPGSNTSRACFAVVQCGEWRDWQSWQPETPELARMAAETIANLARKAVLHGTHDRVGQPARALMAARVDATNKTAEFGFFKLNTEGWATVESWGSGQQFAELTTKHNPPAKLWSFRAAKVIVDGRPMSFDRWERLVGLPTERRRGGSRFSGYLGTDAQREQRLRSWSGGLAPAAGGPAAAGWEPQRGSPASSGQQLPPVGAAAAAAHHPAPALAGGLRIRLDVEATGAVTVTDLATQQVMWSCPTGSTVQLTLAVGGGQPGGADGSGSEGGAAAVDQQAVPATAAAPVPLLPAPWDDM